MTRCPGCVRCSRVPSAPCPEALADRRKARDLIAVAVGVPAGVVLGAVVFVLAAMWVA